MDIYFVYALLDPRKQQKYQIDEFIFEYEPFYIGKGSGERPNFHFYSSRKNQNKHKSSKIDKIKNENLEPIILKLQNNLSEQNAFQLEKFLIKKIGRADQNLGPLVNHTDGGEGASGFKHSTEALKRISQNAKKPRNRGNLKKISEMTPEELKEYKRIQWQKYAPRRKRR